MKNAFIICSCLCMMMSCEKDIRVKLHPGTTQLVVEGKIENLMPPFVVLTHSLQYFSTIDTTALFTSFVHDAEVYVSNGNRRVKLKEYAVDTMGHTIYLYSVDTTDPSHIILGQKGGTYRLSIHTGDEQYEAVTTIPQQGIHLDSIWWRPAKQTEPSDSDKVFLMARFTDPSHKGDYSRYFTQRNSEPFYPGLASVADDQITNGTVFDFSLDRGVSKDTAVDFDEYGYFLKGDTITLKFCDIDQATFDFWRTWEFSFSSNGNPFSSPIQILGNIKGALGYWGGYAVQYKTILIPQ